VTGGLGRVAALRVSIAATTAILARFLTILWIETMRVWGALLLVPASPETPRGVYNVTSSLGCVTELDLNLISWLFVCTISRCVLERGGLHPECARVIP